MKVKSASPFLTLGLALTATLAHAQTQPTYTYSYSYGLSITQSDSGTTASGNAVNVNASAATGVTDAHAATVQLLAGVTCKPSSGPPPTTITVPYELVNRADGDVTLGGMTPPSGTGTGYAAVENLTGDTGTVIRGTTEVNHYVHVDNVVQDKSATVTVTNGWTNNNDGTYTTFVVLETTTLTTRAHIDGIAGAPPSGGKPGGPTPAYPDDASSGYAAMIIQAVTKKPGS